MVKRSAWWRRIAAGTCLVLSAASPGFAQTKAGDVTVGTSLTFTSRFIEGEVPVRIHSPTGTGVTTGARYPVLYMLELGDDFVFGAAVVDFLALTERIPPLMVVAIDVDNLSGTPQGMINFLEQELFPYVERTYRTEPKRLLFGHSGRSFASFFMLLTRPELFDALILPGFGLSWPLEPGRNDLTAMAAERFAKLTSFPKTIVFSLGDERKFFAGIDRFKAMLAKDAPKDMRWIYLPFPEDDHTSTKLKTLYQGLEFVFARKPGSPATKR